MAARNNVLRPFGVLLLLIGFLVNLSACGGSGSRGPQAPGARSGQSEVRGSDTATVQAEPEWYACERDQDCMAVEGVCNSEAAINRLFRGPYVQYRDAMNQQVRCQVPRTVSNAGTTVGCVKKRCIIHPEKLKKPGAPSTNWPAGNRHMPAN